jgi:hypothetical protein
MARSDRWERKITTEPALMPGHHAEANPALLAAQDAAADSLMGNRAQRYSAPSAVAVSAVPASVTETTEMPPMPTSAVEPSVGVVEVATAQPEPMPSMVSEVSTEAVKVVFEVKHESIGQTTTPTVSTTVAVTETAVPVLAQASTSASEIDIDESGRHETPVPASDTPQHEPRRTMRRGLYRRRIVGRRPRRPNDEHAVTDFTPPEPS